MIHIHISYAEKDKKHAEKLRFRIEHFRLKQSGRNRPLEKLKITSNLYNETQECINYLVVICSFNSANDKAVEKEISDFMEKCPINRIVPFVVSGTVNSRNPCDECIPLILREYTAKDMIAIDTLALGWRRAVCKLICEFHSLELSTLEKRIFWHNLKNAAKILALIAIIIGILCSEYYHFGKVYYKEIKYSYHAPVGIDRLNIIERLFEKDYYIFTVATGTVTSVQKRGNPTVYSTGNELQDNYYQIISSPETFYTYHTDGTLDAQINMDENKNTLFIINYGANVDDAYFSADIQGFKPYRIKFKDGTEFCRCSFTYDEQGCMEDIVIIE